MASTRDYLEYLNQKIDIAPVNSEEEYQAAGLIESLMQSHGLETRLQDFEAPGLGQLPYRICGILLFVGVFLAGILGTPAAVVGELVVLATLVLLGLRYLGIADPIGRLGRPVNSQNVIGIHRATGPLVTKGSRPIVIVAHYDTPRENLLFAPPFDRWQKLIRRFSPQFTCVAALLAFVQTFPFVPAGIRHLLWVLAIVAALPQLLVGIAAIQERFTPCTEGSNDNKSGVAAMLGVMNLVHPGDDDATGFGSQRDQRDQDAAQRRALEAEARAAEEAALAEEMTVLEEGEAEPAALTLVGEEVPESAVVPATAEPVAASLEDMQEDYLPEEAAAEQAQGEADGSYLAEEPEVQTVIRHELQVERVEGVRHGKETLESLGILPASCEIVYVDPQTRVRSFEELVYPDGTPAPDAATGYADYPEYYDDEDGYWDEPAGEAGPTALDRVRDFFSGVYQSVSGFIAERRGSKDAEPADAAGDYPAEDALGYDELAGEDANLIEVPTLDPNADQAVEGPSEEDVLLGEVYAVVEGDAETSGEARSTANLTLVPDDSTDSTASLEGTLPFVPLGELTDGREVDDQPKDASGLDTLAEDAAVNESRGSDQAPAPAPVDDPDWGKSSFKPEVSSVARRATLFDLPDPLGKTGAGDPLSGSLDTAAQEQAAAGTPAETSSSTQEPIGTITAQDVQPEKKGGLFGLFRRKDKAENQESIGSWLGVGDDFNAKQAGSEIGSWDNFVAPDSSDDTGEDWKGGAARRSDLRVVGEDDVRVQEDLREAILGMGDDELVSHDIWFVALGGSYADHAGMKAFLEDNRMSVRGCFLINLSCVGSGQLALLSHEGLVGTRKADRRIVRLLTKVADDLHIDLLRTKHDWEDTDATPAMRTSLRCATICGLTDDDALALSQVANDEPDLVDPAQTTAVTDLVAELIRRS